jgi:hypothetical protein
LLGDRIAVPEHFDSRFVATLLPDERDVVVIDTLYSLAPHNSRDTELLLASLNSIVTWYQLELRGRTQHGEGVLKVKLADWDGVLVANPGALGARAVSRLLAAFQPLRNADCLPTAEELARPERQAFDRTYLELVGAKEAEGTRLELERELRAAIGERHHRAHSLDEAKAFRAKTKKVTASVDAFASRIAAQLEPFPDPRAYTQSEDGTLILISTPFEGALRVGEDLFTHGEVFAGEERIASAGDPLAAEFVRGVLLHDPEMNAVTVPKGKQLEASVAAWGEAILEWQKRFEEIARNGLRSVTDDRLKREMRDRALVLLHAR